jgi:hypothetical protein
MKQSKFVGALFFMALTLTVRLEPLFARRRSVRYIVLTPSNCEASSAIMLALKSAAGWFLLFFIVYPHFFNGAADMPRVFFLK